MLTLTGSIGRTDMTGSSRRLSFVGGGATIDSYIASIKTILPTNLIAYYPLTEIGGTVAADHSGNARDGTYSSDVSAWPVIGNINGRTAPIFDGVSHYINIAAAMAALNGSEGTISFWYKIPGVQTWTDAITRQIFEFAVDSNNRLYAYKSAESNVLRTYYHAGGAVKGVAWSSATSTAYNNVIMTWSKAADEYKMYINNAQKEATRTGLGTWGTGTPTGYIGANTNPGAYGYGAICHFAIWDTVISSSDRAAINNIIPESVSWPYLIITDDGTYNAFPGLVEAAP